MFGRRDGRVSINLGEFVHDGHQTPVDRIAVVDMQFFLECKRKERKRDREPVLAWPERNDSIIGKMPGDRCCSCKQAGAWRIPGRF